MLNRRILFLAVVVLFFVSVHSVDVEASSLICTNGNDPPASGNWVIDNTTICTDSEIIMSGNLTITGTGDSTFKNITVIFTPLSNLEQGIEVESGGIFHILDNAAGDPSVITTNDSANMFFRVYGSSSEFLLNNSEVHNVGIGSPDPEDNGLYILADGAIIENSLISDNNIGIIALGNDTVINNNNISDNGRRGVEIGNSSRTATNNKFTNNIVGFNGISITDDGLYIINNENAFISGNTLNDNWGSGIYVDNTNKSTITNNEIYLNDEDGIVFRESKNNTLKNNTIYSNFYGIWGWNSKDLLIKNNTAYSNTNGILFDNTNSSNVSENEIYNNTNDGILMQSDSTGNNFSSNNIDTNTAYNLELDTDQSVDVLAEDNWWGTTDCAAINTSIYDYYDDSTLGIADWEPFLDAAYPTGVSTFCSGAAGGGGGGPLCWFDETDWLVGNTSVCTNATFTLNGNLTINASGNLTLKNVTLNINGSFNGSNKINVESGGAFYILDNDLGESSIIQSLTDFRYLFGVIRDATFRVINSSIHGAGYNSATLNDRGIFISGNDTIIRGSTISFNHYGILLMNDSVAGKGNALIEDNQILYNDVYGIYIDSRESDQIKGNVINNNSDAGIRTFFLNNGLITNNTVYSHPGDAGIRLTYSVDGTISDNVVYDNAQGIHTQHSINLLIQNNTAYLNTYGINLENTNDTDVLKNEIYDSSLYGITVRTNSTGLNISLNNIYNNTPYDMILESSVPLLQSVDVLAEDNYWGTTDCAAINTSIYDYYDDSTLGIADFEPLLNDSYPLGSSMNCASGETPTIFITTANGTRTNSAQPVIDYYYTDPDSSTATVKLYFYSLVSTEVNVPENTPSTISPDTPETEGLYWFWIEVDDGVNTNTSLNYTITIDKSHPGGVTGLGETSTGVDWIYWEWTDPTDPDFDHVLVSINGSGSVSVAAGVQLYNATGLLQNTLYEIGTQTVDDVGNVNDTWVNDTASTDADVLFPAVTMNSPDNNTVANTGTITFECSAFDNYGVDKVMLYLNRSPDFDPADLVETQSVSGKSVTVTFDRTIDETGDWFWGCGAEDLVGLGVIEPYFTLTLEEPSKGKPSPGRGGGTNSPVVKKTTVEETVNNTTIVEKTISTPSGKVINLVKEFGEKGMIKLTVKVSDVIQVEINKEEHTMTITKINPRAKTVTMVIRSEPTEVIIEEGGTMLIDVDSDGVYDIKIIIEKINGDETELIVEDLNKIPPPPTGFLGLTGVEFGLFGLAVGVLLIGSVSYMYWRRNEAI